jgi:hypothetical protein
MKAAGRRRQEEISQLSPEDLKLLMEAGRPPPNLGVSDWRQRWEGGAYKQLEPWQLAWGLLRHWDEYWYNWAFDIGPRMTGDGSIIPEVPRDTTKWAKKYDLQHAINPSLSSFELSANPFRSPRAQRSTIFEGPKEVNVVLRANQAIILVDLSRLIPPQLAAAERCLQPRTLQRLQLKIYPRYVCALDAKAAGATYGAIGKVLHPRQDELQARLDRVKKDLRAARSLSASGYGFVARG